MARPIGNNNILFSGVTCFKCNNFGHISRDYRSQVNYNGPRYGISTFTHYKCNHLGRKTKYCRFHGFVSNIIMPNVRRNNSINLTNYENINHTFVNETNGGNEKARKEKREEYYIK